MAARKAMHLEPPPFVAQRSSKVERKEGAKRFFPEHMQQKVPWRLIRLPPLKPKWFAWEDQHHLRPTAAATLARGLGASGREPSSAM